jgi:molybdate transport system substrate-binding protein
LKRIEAGQSFDVAILVPQTIDGWIKQGRVVADTRTNIGRASLGVAFRAGVAKPDVSSSDALKRTLLGANAVSYFPGGAVGKHFASVLDRLGIAAAMQPKLRPVKAGGASPTSVAKGEADLAIAFIPAILGTLGVALAGPFPSQLALYVDLVAGVGSATREPEAAKAFVTFLASPEGVAAIKAKGLEPIAP